MNTFCSTICQNHDGSKVRTKNYEQILVKEKKIQTLLETAPYLISVTHDK